MIEEWSDVSVEDWMDYIHSDGGQVVRDVVDPLMLREVEAAGKRVLDVGCGEGYFARVLRAEGAAEVVGCDMSENLLARARAQDPDGSYHVADINTSTLDLGTFDAITASMVLMYLPNLDRVFKNIAASLGPSGRFVASMTNPYYSVPVGRWAWGLRSGLYSSFDPKKRSLRLTLRQIAGVVLGRFEWVLVVDNYFETRWVQKNLGSAMAPHYHQPFSAYLNAASSNGLRLTAFLEPRISSDVLDKYQHESVAPALRRVPLLFVLVFEKESA